MSRMTLPIAILAVALGALGGAGTAEAQPPSNRRQPRVIELTDDFVIEGRVQKPNAFYILNRSNLGYEVMDLRRSFLPDLVRTVQHDPF
ncbi:MAG: hypothetical protein U0230_07055 [Polyangiales bacterium]